MRAFSLLLLTAAIAIADPKPGDVGTPEHKQAGELVKQLGHPKYTIRESAAKQLLKMGPTAVVALIEGTKASDEEVRNRSAALLPQAKAAEWKRRSAAYLADAEGKQKHDLPLLAEWEKLVGKPDVGSRKIFAQMISADGEFLQAVASDKKKAAKVCNDRCKNVLAELRTAKGQIKGDLGDVAALLFLDTFAPSQYDWSNQAYPCHLLTNPIVIETLDAADTGPALRRLLMKWAEARPAHDSYSFQRFASLVQKKPFPEAAGYLAKTATDKNADVLSTRLLAVQALGKVGGKEAAATLAGLVEDATPLFNGSTEDYRLGDSALAASITMHGKKLADFSLTHNGGIGFSNGDGDEIVSLELHGFANADARAKAIKKWKEEIAVKKDGKEKK
jgi:hypothetical protein